MWVLIEGEGAGFPEVSCNYGCWELDLGPLWGLHELLTSGLFLHPQEIALGGVVSFGASWCLKYVLRFFLHTYISETSQANSDTMGQAPEIGGWTNPSGKQCVQCESKKHLPYTDAVTPPSTWELRLKFGFRKITKLPLLLLWLYSTLTVECLVGLLIVWAILSLWVKTPLVLQPAQPG